MAGTSWLPTSNTTSCCCAAGGVVVLGPSSEDGGAASLSLLEALLPGSEPPQAGAPSIAGCAVLAATDGDRQVRTDLRWTALKDYPSLDVLGTPEWETDTWDYAWYFVAKDGESSSVNARQVTPTAYPHLANITMVSPASCPWPDPCSRHTYAPPPGDPPPGEPYVSRMSQFCIEHVCVAVLA
jgi:hypothetical protein